MLSLWDWIKFFLLVPWILLKIAWSKLRGKN